MKDVHELANWARKASRIERRAKRHLARLIYGQRRARCRLLGCRNLESSEPCPRCGARGPRPKDVSRSRR